MLLHLGPGLGNGLANLHNARRGKVPVVNIVGDQFGVPGIGLRTGDLVAVAVAGHGERVDRYTW